MTNPDPLDTMGTDACPEGAAPPRSVSIAAEVARIRQVVATLTAQVVRLRETSTMSESDCIELVMSQWRVQRQLAGLRPGG